MEFVEAISIFLFILFCGKILLKYQNLIALGVQVAAPKPRSTKIVNALVLSLFAGLFMYEMFAQLVFLDLPLFLGPFSVQLIQSAALKIIGLFICSLAVYTMSVTLFSFQESFRFGLDSNNLGELKTEGIFALSRNPFFASILLLFTGVTLVFCTIFFIGISLSAALSIHFFILREERFMRENYGKAYIDYCQRVRRYI